MAGGGGDFDDGRNLDFDRFFDDLRRCPGTGTAGAPQADTITPRLTSRATYLKKRFPFMGDSSIGKCWITLQTME